MVLEPKVRKVESFDHNKLEVLANLCPLEPMGNKFTTKKHHRVTIESCAVNVEEKLAHSGKHLDQLCSLDRQLYCSVKTRGASSSKQSGAFLWYLCSPTSKQLKKLSSVEDWSDRYFQPDTDADGNRCMNSVQTLTTSTDVLICRNDLDLSVGNENVWDQLNHDDRSRIEMTMNSTFDLRNAEHGLVPGNYRVDFYRSDSPFTPQFFTNNLPTPSKSITFHVQS